MATSQYIRASRRQAQAEGTDALTAFQNELDEQAREFGELAARDFPTEGGR